MVRAFSLAWETILIVVSNGGSTESAPWPLASPERRSHRRRGHRPRWSVTIDFALKGHPKTSWSAAQFSRRV